MPNVIRHKRGTSDPSASDFSNTAELLVNTTDGGLFTKDDSDNVVEIGSGGGSSGKEFFSITNNIAPDGNAWDGNDGGSRPAGSQGAAATVGNWKGHHPDISSLFDGMTIAFYQNNIAGDSTTTLELFTADETSLGEKPIYYSNNSRLTTQYGARALIMLQYDDGQGDGGRFYAHDFYYASSFTTRVQWNNDLKVGNISVTGSRNRLDGYQLLMEGIDGAMYPVTVCKSGETAYNTITDNPVQTAELRVGGLMLLYESGTNQASNVQLTRNELFTAYEGTRMEFWNNRADTTWAEDNKPWYIVATMNANGNFVLNVLDESNNASTTAFLTQDLPENDNGKFYIHGGFMNNTSDAFRLQVDHPIYVYKDGKVRTYTGYASDADKLDGLEATSFTRTTGTSTLGNNLECAYNPDGTTIQLNLGRRVASSTGAASLAYIDLTSDNTYYDYGLRIARYKDGSNSGNDGNNTSRIAHKGTGELQIYCEEAADTVFKRAGETKLKVTSDGISVYTGVWQSSDITLKDNVSTLENVLESIKQIRGVNFTWKEDGRKSVGVIAQEVETVFPELITEDEGVKGVNHSGLVGVLIEAVKELSDRVTALESG